MITFYQERQIHKPNSWNLSVSDFFVEQIVNIVEFLERIPCLAFFPPPPLFASLDLVTEQS